MEKDGLRGDLLNCFEDYNSDNFGGNRIELIMVMKDFSKKFVDKQFISQGSPMIAETKS